MAKSTSKSTKAKTKTTKKTTPTKVAKSSKTTKSTQTVKSSTSKVEKSTAVAADTKKNVKELRFAKVGRRSREVTAALLSKWHVASAAVFVVLAALAGLFMQSTVFDINIGFLTNNALLSEGGTVFAPAERLVWSVDLRWLVVATLLVSALFSLIRARNSAVESRALKARIAPWRWVDYAVTGALMVETMALLSGVNNIVELKFFGVLAVLSMVFAWVAERENADAPRFVKMSYLASVLTGAVMFLGLAAYAVATPVWGMVRAPWYVYALYAASVVVATAVAWLQLKAYRHVKQWTNYHVVERDYAMINLFAKVAFAVILVVGLYKA